MEGRLATGPEHMVIEIAALSKVAEVAEAVEVAGHPGVEVAAHMVVVDHPVAGRMVVADHPVVDRMVVADHPVILPEVPSDKVKV